MIRPIMICAVSDGRYHGRRICTEPVELIAAAFSTKSEVDRAVPCSMLTNVGEAEKYLVSSGGAADPPFQCSAHALNCGVFLTHLECTACGLHHDWSRLQNLCTVCGKPLFAIYDLAAAG